MFVEKRGDASGVDHDKRARGELQNFRKRRPERLQLMYTSCSESEGNI